MIPLVDPATVRRTDNQRNKEYEQTCREAQRRRQMRGVAEHSAVDSSTRPAVPRLRNATPNVDGISGASREGSGTDGLRGFERNHGNVASPGRLPSDWLFLAFPPIPWILARVSPRRATPPPPLSDYRLWRWTRGGKPPCDVAMAEDALIGLEIVPSWLSNEKGTMVFARSRWMLQFGVEWKSLAR